MKLRARTKTACEIAQIDPKLLDEMFHAGRLLRFPLSFPVSRPGASMVFDVDQIVSLRIFRVLLDLTLSASKAGSVAIRAYSEFSGRHDVGTIVFWNSRYQSWSIEYRDSDDHLDDLPGVGLYFNIPELRKEITERLEAEQENPVVGDDLE